MNKYENLKIALEKAKEAAKNAWIEDDGGSCNFDSPVLNYREMQYSKAKAIKTIESLGLSCYAPYSKYWSGCLIISRCTNGQGFRRTKMAEAFSKSLKESGISSTVYYQLD